MDNESEIIDQFLKLRESFAKNDYKLWVDLWPAFEKVLYLNVLVLIFHVFCTCSDNNFF